MITMLAESHQNYFLDPYSSFLGLLDHLPPFPHSSDSVKHADQAIAEIMRCQFWIQRSNLLVNYYCLHMEILNRLAEHGLTMMIGVQNTETVIALPKTEIAHDMNVFVINAPIDSLLVNGEACVSRVHLPQDPKTRRPQVFSLNFYLVKGRLSAYTVDLLLSQVTKIRYMSATLLELIHKVQAPQVVKRANSLFSSLLDVLTKLNSRASDERQRGSCGN
jgi:hypothetical protein